MPSGYPFPSVLDQEIARTRQAQAVNSIWGGYPIWTPMFSSGIAEPFPGAWQRNVDFNNQNTLLMFSAVFCCITGIASDVAKNRIKLSRNINGIWEEITENSPFLPVLRKPNHFQSLIQFLESWLISKLEYGNTYILLERDNRGGGDRTGVVNAMYVLHPCRVKPMVSDAGEVFYDLGEDYLNQVEEHIVIPASEIIHDRFNCLWHPLIGVSPLYACALSVLMGNKIQSNSTQFFANQSLPGGMLTAPGKISTETAERIKMKFEENFSGGNMGRLFVAGEGLKFEPFMITAEQSDLAKQLEFTVADVARAFHYPAFKLGGPLPPYSGNMQALTLSYYTDCLQILIESVEKCLDEGLSLPSGQGTEMDIDNLLRMDTSSLFESNNKAVGGGWMEPNEARFRANLEPVTGGDTPYLQQQNYSLAALAKRDSGADPFQKQSSAATTPEPQPPNRSIAETTMETRLALLESSLRRDFALNGNH